MGVPFMLAATFGSDISAARTARTRVDAAAPVEVLGLPARLIPSGPRDAQQAVLGTLVTVSVQGIAHGGQELPGLDWTLVTDDVLTGVGTALYALLGNFPGYQAALVGWEAEEALEDAADYPEHSEWRFDPAEYQGLVLRDDLHQQWALPGPWAAFVRGYLWLPYVGSVSW